jgi:hypothetical protein
VTSEEKDKQAGFFVSRYPNRKVKDGRVLYKGEIYFHPGLAAHKYVHVDDYGNRLVTFLSETGTSINLRAILPENCNNI